MNIRKIFPNTCRPRARKLKPRSSQLRTLIARVRTIELTPPGHVSCVLDTPIARLKTFSDAASVHLPALNRGRSVRVVLLRLRRETAHGTWEWQVLACQRLEESDLGDTNLHLEGRSA